MPSVYAAAADFVRRVDALDAAALEELARRLADILPGLVAEAERLAASAQTEGQAMAAVRARQLAARVAAEIRLHLDRILPELDTAHQQAAVAGLDAAQRLAESALPAGLTLDALARFGLPWVDPGLGPLQQMTGAVGGASPLRSLLAQLGPEAERHIATALIRGIVVGHNPRKTAQVIRQQVALTKSRAETISRTESLRAYREATRAAYEANPGIVKGYERQAHKGPRTCVLCLALDGRRQRTDEVMPTHPNCRCTVVPVTVSWSDLGVDLPDRRAQRESGADWFARQPVERQREMLGPGGYAAYQQGADLEDFVRIRRDREWGPTLERRTLAEVSR